MDKLAFDVIDVANDGYPYRGFAILVNGRRLEALAREVELPFAKAEGSPDLAGDYSPLALTDIRSDPSHFLGTPVATWFQESDTVLMGCPCGDWGCWPLTAKVEVVDGGVRWHTFRNGHRDWDLSALGPFDFDRAQYEAALTALA
jgi:hypothetical protein